jgi:hypothetical protein
MTERRDTRRATCPGIMAHPGESERKIRSGPMERDSDAGASSVVIDSWEADCFQRPASGSSTVRTLPLRARGLRCCSTWWTI